MNSLQRANFQYDAKAALHYSETTIFYGKIRRLGFAECRFSSDSILRSINAVHLKETIPLISVSFQGFVRFFQLLAKKEGCELPGFLQLLLQAQKIQDAGRSNFHVLIVF